MAVTAISEYTTVSRSAAELYGDNQLVHVWWKGNPFFVAAFCFPFPKAMPWGAFIETMQGIFSSDPDFVPESLTTVQWFVDGEPVNPAPDASLESIGVGHKSLIHFEL